MPSQTFEIQQRALIEVIHTLRILSGDHNANDKFKEMVEFTVKATDPMVTASRVSTTLPLDEESCIGI